MKRTTVIILCFIAVLCGLGFARLKFELHSQILVLVAMFPVMVYRINKKLFGLSLLMVCFCLGWLRGQAYMDLLQEYDQVFRRQSTMYVTAITDANYSERKQLSFTATDITIIQPDSVELIGEITVEGFGAPMIFRGDRVRVEGKIYPTLGGKQGAIRFANMHIVGHERNVVDKIRHRFVAGVYTALPEPMASFALGLLVGQRSTLPANISDVLTVTGLTHIVAVSGYNLTIIVRATQNLRAKKSRYQATVLALGLVLLFVLMVGSSPSIVRAALVSVLSIICWYYGRTIRPVLLILLVAAATALYKPTYLWSDIGWYLSFLAFFGVLVLAPLIVRKFSRSKEPKLFKLVLLETICAQILTAPIILYIFGRTSALGIIANVLIVPLVPLAMLLSLIAGVFGMMLPHLASLFAFPAKVLLSYMLSVATLFSRIPHITFERTITLTQMLGAYGVVGFVTMILWHKNRDRNGIISKRSNQEP